MDKMKFGVLGGGILGVVGSFLPIAMGISLFDLVTMVPGQGLPRFLGLVIGLVMGVLGLVGKMTRTYAIIAMIGFALSFVMMLDAIGGEIGGKLLWIGAVIGLVSSIACVIKPEGSDA